MSATEKPLAKGKVKLAHSTAIKQYERWLKANDNKPLKMKIRKFDYFVDKNAA